MTWKTDGSLDAGGMWTMTQQTWHLKARRSTVIIKLRKNRRSGIFVHVDLVLPLYYTQA